MLRLVVLSMLTLLFTAAPSFAQEVAAEPPPWWAAMAEIAVTALAGVLSLAVAVLLPMAREWVAARTQLGHVMRSQILADKMDEGARNIIRAVEVRLKEAIPGGQPTKEEIARHAQPVVEREFKETLNHFKKSPEAVKDYVLARVEEKTTAGSVSGVGSDEGVPTAVARYRKQHR